MYPIPFPSLVFREILKLTACLETTLNEWFASNRIPMLGAKNSGITRGPTLQVTRRKCIAKSCFDVQKNNFGERSTLFHRFFFLSKMNLGNVDKGSGLCEHLWACEECIYFCEHKQWSNSPCQQWAFCKIPDDEQQALRKLTTRNRW